MTVAFIGSCGHAGYALEPVLADPAFGRIALAGASAEDEMSGMLESCRRSGRPVRFYENWQTLLREETPEIVVNCTVCARLAEVSIAALRSGAHVLCEKPMARTAEELAELAAAYRSCGRVLLSMLPFRYEPGFRAAHQAVLSGVLGEVRLLNVQKSYKLGARPAYYRDPALYGGTIPWVGAHAIDLLLFLSGQHMLSAAAWQSAAGNGGTESPEITAACAFGMTGGVVATASLDYLRPAGAPGHGDDRVRVVGTEGILEVTGGQAILLRDGAATLPDVPCVSLFEDFRNQIRGIGRPRLTGEECLENAIACLGARTAAETGAVFHF